MSVYYEIQIDYQTGDSFNTEEIEGEAIGLVNRDLDKAKENLKRIKDHYARCSDNPNTGDRYQLTLLQDEGEITITPFWIGYFETLRGANIVCSEEGEDDMSFNLP